MKENNSLSYQSRWSRIFRKNNKSVIVALDHFPSGFMPGWEFPENTIKKILDGNPDAIMTNYGIIKTYGSLLAGRVGIILRMDGSPTYLLEEWPNYKSWELFYTVEDAINLGVDAVIVNVFVGGKTELINMKIATRIAAECYKHGLPCVFETLPSIDGNNPELLSFAARLGAEFGADFIKTYYPGSPEGFMRITSRCPIPVLIAGGPKTANDKAFLQMVHGAMESGGCGVFGGRNIWQHSNPAALLQALNLIVHENASIEDAISLIANQQ